RNLYLTANQCSVGPCDVGTVFIGSFADRNGDEWLNDAEGNYPNGLLYRTGYEYSYESVKDLFEGSMSVTASVTTSVTNYDLPSLVTLNGRNISEAIDTVVGTIGLVYFFDDDLKEFRVYQDSALKDFPQAPYTFEEGKDIATVQYGLDGTQVVTRVTVIGSTPDLFYSTGTGARETIITDTSLTSLEACQVKAVQYLAAFAQSRTVGKFRCAPIDVPVLGYNVNTVSRFGRRDANGNWVTTSANVVGVTHNFGPDHWFTELDLESTRNTIPRTLVEIQDEITKGNNTTDSPVAYLSIVGNGVLPDAATMSNICAIGVGSSSDETSLMRAIVQVSAAPYVPKAGGPTVTAASISNQFGGRVRELGVYMNNLTNGACVDATMSVQIPTGSALFGAFVEQAQGVYLGNIAETYPLGATSIAVNPTSSNDAWFWMKAQDVSALRVVAMSDTDYGGMTSYWQFPDAGAPWENTLHCTLAQEEEVSRMGSLAPAIPFNRQVDIAPSQWQGPGGIIALYMDFALVVPNDKWEAVKELIVNLDACHVDINAIDTYTGVGTWNIWNTGVPTPRWDPIYTITSSRIDGGSGNLDPHAFSFPFPNEHTASNQAQYVAPDGHVRLAFRMDGYANTEIQGPALAVDFNHVGLAYKLDRSKCTDYRFYKGTTWAPWDNNRHGYVMPELPGRSEIVDYRFNYKEVLEGHTASFDVSIKNFLDFYGLPVYTPGILTSYSGAPKGSVTAVLTDRLLMASYGKWDDGSISQAVVPVSPLNPREYIDYGNEGYDQIDWGIGLNLQDGLVRAGGIQVLYTYSVGDVLDMEPPNNPGPTYFPMKYTSNDMRAANICMSTGNLCVEPGVPLSIAYKAVGGELAKRFVVGPETRIDQGIGKDASTTIHVSAEMALGHVDGSTGIIGGPGVALPGAR
ncbi:MAG: hypothetical protein WCK39_05365, partial [Methanomassiliicoccales archaeon]